MISYCEKFNPNRCCGCKACSTVCPKEAISFVSNNEGFVYPKIDYTKCINCNLCSTVCPYDTKVIRKKPLEIYALQIKDEKALHNSSSGGAFWLLANYVLNRGGYVTGAVFNSDFFVEMEITNDLNVVKQMMGSKYVYCNPNGIYVKVKEKLDCGFLVLFTGSPCQCAALRLFLKKEYHNLIVADFLCHGMPSSLAFSYYLSYLNKKKKIAEIRFRDKEKKGWGMVFSYVRNGKKQFSVESTNSYLFAFQSGFLNRYSCYNCKFRGKERFTDFTFSDFWGVDNFHKEIDYRKGVSALSINTEKAQTIKQELEQFAIMISTKRDYVAVGNPAIMYDSVEEPIPEIRKNIYNLLHIYGWKRCSRHFFKPKNYFLKKIWYSLPRFLTNGIKKIIK